MQISTLLSLLICFNAAQATAIRRENRYGYGSVRHRPDYEHNEENDRRPVGGPQPPATTMTGTTKMVGGAATERPQAIVTIRPTITVNPVTTITSQDAITMTSQDTTTTTTTTTTATATADQLATASTTVTQPATSTQTADPAFSSVALQRHNIHRSNHSAPDATWNTDLAGYAKTVADGCKFEHDMFVALFSISHPPFPSFFPYPLPLLYLLKLTSSPAPQEEETTAKTSPSKVPPTLTSPRQIIEST